MNQSGVQRKSVMSKPGKSAGGSIGAVTVNSVADILERELQSVITARRCDNRGRGGCAIEGADAALHGRRCC
jgi:hypothetical protein